MKKKQRRYFCDWIDENQFWLVPLMLIIVLIVVIVIFLVMLYKGNIDNIMLKMIEYIVIALILWILAIYVLEFFYHMSKRNKSKR